MRIGCLATLANGMLLLTSLVFANHNPTVFGLDLGISTTKSFGNTTTFPLGYSTYNYIPEHSRLSPIPIGVSLRKHFIVSTLDAVQIGLSYHYITNMKVNGTLEQGISPPFYPFAYGYSVKSDQVLAEAKLQHESYETLYPYLIAGIGAGFNNARNYTTNIPPYVTFTPYYMNKSITSFSYTAGFGIDYLAFKSLSIGVGYRFSDLGAAGLGSGRIQNLDIASQLTRSHLYFNTGVIELNCFF